MADMTPCPEQTPHKRSRSAVLKSFIKPSSSTPSPTKTSPTKQRSKFQSVDIGKASTAGACALPSDHSHASDRQISDARQSKGGVPRSPQKQSANNSGQAVQRLALQDCQNSSPTKGRPVKGVELKDKENKTPPSTASTDWPTPIWAQFASQSVEAQPNTSRDDKRAVEEDRPSNRICARDFANTGAGSTTSSQTSQGLAQDRPWDESSTRPSSNSSATSMASDNSSKVKGAIAMFNNKSQSCPKAMKINPEQLNSAFEAVLIQRNIPDTMRQAMRNLDPVIKAEFIRHSREEEPPKEEPKAPKSSVWNTLRRGRAPSSAETPRDQRGVSASPSKRSRSKARTDTPGKGDGSPNKRARSNSRPRSIFSLRNLSSSSVHRSGLDGATDAKNTALSPRPGDESDSLRRPGDFVQYLQETSNVVKDFDKIEEAKVKRLRSLLRSESVSWVETFVLKDGMELLIGLFERLKKKEWREAHDEKLMHQTLLCLKAVCTTQRAMDRLATAAASLFPGMLAMLFDEERRGPSEFSTRAVIINLLLEHLRAATPEQMPLRSKAILSYLADPIPETENQPVDWLAGMKQRRPYLLWSKEFAQVTREVFWMFTHRSTVIPLPADDSNSSSTASYLERNFPKTRPPEALNPWVGGVEWDTANYITAHVDLMVGLLAATPTREERNRVRDDLRASDFEKALSVLRTCKEKFYAAPHDAIRAWIAAAVEDGWNADHVRMEPDMSETKSPNEKDKAAPKLELPGFDLGNAGDGWNQ